MKTVCVQPGVFKHQKKQSFCTRCPFCHTDTVQVQEDGTLMCVECFTEHGVSLESSFIQFSFFGKTLQYCPDKYFEMIIKPFENKDTVCVPEDMGLKIKQMVKKGTTWQEINKLLTKMKMHPEDKITVFHTIPAYLGFNYEYYEDWVRMATKAKHVALKFFDLKLNNMYAFYQCVRCTNYVVDWIPMTLSKSKCEEMDMHWIKISRILNYPYYPVQLKTQVRIRSAQCAPPDSTLLLDNEDQNWGIGKSFPNIFEEFENAIVKRTRPKEQNDGDDECCIEF